MNINNSNQGKSDCAAAGESPRTTRRVRSQDARSEEMRARLIAASIEVLQERGFAGFRTEAVAKVANVSRGALVHHYPHKRDLILAVHKHLYQLAVDKSAESAAAVTDQGAIIDEILKDAQSFFFDGHFFSVLGIVLSANTDPELKSEILQESRNARLSIETAWIDRMSEFMPRRLAENVVYMTYNIVRGYAMRTLWEDDPARYAEMIVCWKSMVCDLLRKNGVTWPAA